MLSRGEEARGQGHCVDKYLVLIAKVMIKDLTFKAKARTEDSNFVFTVIQGRRTDVPKTLIQNDLQLNQEKSIVGRTVVFF